MIHCLLGTNKHMAKYDQMHLTFKANLYKIQHIQAKLRSVDLN